MAREYYYKALDSSDKFIELMDKVNANVNMNDEELKALKEYIQEMQSCNAKAIQLTNDVMDSFL
jgi:hypothetical protein